MTDQMEPIDDSTMYRRKIDNTLARFSAAHDELEAEEEERRQKRQWLTSRVEQTRTKLHRVVAGVIPKRDSGGDRGSETGDPDDDEEDAQGHSSQTRLQEKKQRHTERTQRASRITTTALAIIVFLVTGVLWGTKTWFDSKFNEIAALDEDSEDIRNAAGQTGDQNFLIVGSDTRAGAQAGDNIGDPDGIPGARSDTVMVAHVPEDRKRAVVVSLPRDLEISRPACKRWDSVSGEYGELLPPTQHVKLNTAFNIGGPRCVTKTIQQLTGMKITHFVGIDFNGFKDMVDAVGGVWVDLKEPVRDAELGLIVAETGRVKLEGEQALSFVRARKVYGDPTFSDYGRIKRQQQFLSSLLEATLSRDVLLNPGKLTAFVNAFAQSTFGENISVDHLLTLAQSMQGLSAGNVEFLTIPTVGTANERGNEVLRRQESDALFRALVDNKPLPGEEPANPAPKAGQQVDVPTSESRRAAPA